MSNPETIIGFKTGFNPGLSRQEGPAGDSRESTRIIQARRVVQAEGDDPPKCLGRARASERDQVRMNASERGSDKRDQKMPKLYNTRAKSVESIDGAM